MKIVSLFSGAGGLDLGFKMAGHEIIWANDLFSDAVDTYRNNLGNHIVLKDVTAVSAEDIPDCDMIIGGFPCQGFSVANTKRSVNDERNQLYKQFLRLTQAKKSKFFLAENVKGIMSLAKGKILEMIINDFRSIGYNVEVKLLNAANYGVPQLRQRVFIVGVRNDVDFLFQYPNETHSENGSNHLEKWVTVGKALSDLPCPDKPNDLSNHEYSKYKLRFNGYIGHRTIDPERPAPTVTARGDDKGGVVVLHHPSNERRMSCRELAVIQSFPLDYAFYGTRSSVYRQIGNAVPPLLAYAIAKQFDISAEG